MANLGQFEVFPLCLPSDEKETGTLQGPQQKYCAWQKQVAPDIPKPVDQRACTYKYRRKRKRNIWKVNGSITYCTRLNLTRFIKSKNKIECSLLGWGGGGGGVRSSGIGQEKEKRERGRKLLSQTLVDVKFIAKGLKNILRRELSKH